MTPINVSVQAARHPLLLKKVMVTQGLGPDIPCLKGDGIGITAGATVAANSSRDLRCLTFMGAPRKIRVNVLETDTSAEDSVTVRSSELEQGEPTNG